MAILTINGNEYFSYATVEEADTFLFVQPSTEIWFALSEDAKAKNLVAASTWLDSLSWKTECSPRSLRESSISFKYAAISLANSIANGNIAFMGATVQEAATKRLRAGAAEIEFFASISSFTANPNNPLTNLSPYVRSLISNCLLAGVGSGIGGSISFGTDYISTANDPWDYSK